MKPICVPCRRFFRCKKVGFYFLEGAPTRNDIPPGLAQPADWHPYKVWVADVWECAGCGAQILSGFGQQPISEHYKLEFTATVRALNADQFQVNDC